MKRNKHADSHVNEKKNFCLFYFSQNGKIKRKQNKIRENKSDDEW